MLQNVFFCFVNINGLLNSEDLGWQIELDEFTQDTVIGKYLVYTKKKIQ